MAIPPRLRRKAGSALAAVVLATVLIGLVRPAQAQYVGGNENIQGFTVVGKGFVAAKPNLLEIDLEVTAASELSADAIVKYRDARKRIRDAFAALKLGNVTVEERGLLVDQKGMMQSPYFMGGMPNTRSKTEVQLTRKLIVKGSDIRKMDEEALLQLTAKLLDVAQDAGAHVGPPQMPYWYYYDYPSRSSGLVRFILEDFDKLQEEAYEKAIAEARTRAERLARLSHVELGPIVAVREITVPGDQNPVPNYNFYYNRGTNSDEETPRKRLETSKFQEIPVRVELLVRFEIHPKSEGKGRSSGP
ncbi:MAG TPA: SIMPL domain-containing protein [Isosphaeraceae bacterium]|nr:SIMPL domain-containing protein [Isosphaeraceae bacterium]